MPRSMTLILDLLPIYELQHAFLVLSAKLRVGNIGQDSRHINFEHAYNSSSEDIQLNLPTNFVVRIDLEGGT